MSIESILKANKTGRTRKKRSSGVVAHDSKYTGEEPVWDGWKDWPRSEEHTSELQSH